MRLPPLLCPLILLLGSLVGSGAQSLPRNAEAVGLWAGEVTLNQVTHVRAGTNAPTADTAQLRLILHVAADGRVRLLKEVTVARKTSGNNDLILISDPALLPGVGGVVRRNGKLVGQRIATAAFDFAGTELPLEGGIGRNFTCTGVVPLAAEHPTNPFRHKYHPDHAVGLELRRVLTLTFPQAATTVNGIPQLVGAYEETVTGLHKTPLTAKGVVTLQRLSTVPTLNP